MKPTRRNFLFGVAGAALQSPAWASELYGRLPGQLPSPTGVVALELINFHCPRCRAVNLSVPRFHTLASSVGIDFRVAPITWEGQSPWPARMFYSTRDLFPKAEVFVRDVIFEGIHRDGLTFENLQQTVAYFEKRDILKKGLSVHENFSLAAIAERTADETLLIAEIKAARLLEKSGARDVPVVLWIKDGDIQKSLSPAPGSDAASFVQRVVHELSPKPST